ncbi:unnamed protein product [Somion occarium]|uniref:NADH:flavin oxidoreductase/NADH oxidase N-terminal domain-containing protein n=1 Tax=Somion occarium TaxID=3059160 RepID=A0ABP1DR73_9APHY
MASRNKLFEPINVGSLSLRHRVVLAPLTRSRATAKHVHNTALAAEYYRQRSSVPGTLLISEATVVAGKAGGLQHVPNVETQEQVEAWKGVCEAVHEKDCFIFMQLWAHGRSADPRLLAKEGGWDVVSASDVPLTGRRKPRPLTTSEVKEYIEFYANAASRAVHEVGFDGVEIHAANGYLIDQFLQDKTNHRNDEYGGSIENRARFALEILQAITEKVGQEKVGIRLSPWEYYNEMRMDDPIPTFTYLVKRIAELYPNLAWIHVVEPRISGNFDREVPEGESNDFIREIWAPRPIISAGGYTRDIALEVAETKGDLIAFGRYFISNPDLPRRLKENLPLNPYNRATFYHPPESPVGYIDYPFADAVDAQARL